MTLFAARQQLSSTPPGDIRDRRAACWSAYAPYQVRRSYWTEENRQLLVIYDDESAASAAPLAPDEGRDTMQVIEFEAEEYLPYNPEAEARVGATHGGAELPLVLVSRRVGSVEEDEFRALAFRAIMCAFEYRGMFWLRSYWAPERGEILCLFRTRTHDLVREHAERSRIPCDAIYDAVELSPPVSLPARAR